MDSFVMTAYAIVGAYLGFVFGVLVRGSYVERHPPEGGEPPAPPPEDRGPADWARWEDELATVALS